jgi:hypothetical protein
MALVERCGANSADASWNADRTSSKEQRPRYRGERLDQSLNTALGRRLLVDEGVAQIEEKPKGIPHRSLVPDLTTAGRRSFLKFASQWRAFSWSKSHVVPPNFELPRFRRLRRYARFVNTNQSISSVTAPSGSRLAR